MQHITGCDIDAAEFTPHLICNLLTFSHGLLICKSFCKPENSKQHGIYAATAVFSDLRCSWSCPSGYATCYFQTSKGLLLLLSGPHPSFFCANLPPACWCRSWLPKGIIAEQCEEFPSLLLKSTKIKLSLSQQWLTQSHLNAVLWLQHFGLLLSSSKVF